MTKMFIGKATIVITMFTSFLAAPSDANAQAASGNGFKIGISFFKLDTSTDGANLGNYDGSVTLLNGKIGYTMPSGLYFGGIYDARTDENNGAKAERTGFGGSVGYHNGGWYIDGALYISSTDKLSGGTELKEGTGFGVDLGHDFDLTPNIYLGLQLSYKSFTYSKAGSVDATNKYKSELSPMINLGVMF